MITSKKCIVWDMDNTLWDGIILEGKVILRPEIRDTIVQLDQKGILHSIASRNDEDMAMNLLREHHLDHYFISPRINWLPKTTNIIGIVNSLNISLDSVAFVDDDPFELNQVKFMLPDVMTIDAKEAGKLNEMPEFNPGYTTQESISRRELYQADQNRKVAESQFSTRQEFLSSCKMKLSVRPMEKQDIPRVSELMTRTHQLNTTGQIFSGNRLLEIAQHKHLHENILVAELRDKFGWNGIIGTALIKHMRGYLRIIFFAMSCRIVGRGIERAFLTTLVRNAVEQGYQKIEALFRNTGRNSMMRALYQMSGFSFTNELADHTMIFRLDCNKFPEIPPWVEVT